MKVVFDSSALFKRYAGETGCAEVQAWHERAQSVVLAAHCLTELVSALSRQWREGAFSDDEYHRVLARMREDFLLYDVMPLSSTVQELAIAALMHSPVRAMDALHVGTAKATHADVFVTADRRQADAGRLAGLHTILIAP